MNFTRIYFGICALVITLSAVSCATTIGKVIGAERACIAARQ